MAAKLSFMKTINGYLAFTFYNAVQTRLEYVLFGITVAAAAAAVWYQSSSHDRSVVLWPNVALH